MGKIILSHHFEEELEHQLSSLDRDFVRIFRCEEFKIDDAHEVIAQAYISSHQKKTLLIIANSFNVFAQNALLKVLEEPPSNIDFILMAKNKNALLNTVRSRLLIEDKRQKVIPKDFVLNLKQMQLQDIYAFLKSDADTSIEAVKQEIQSLLFSAYKLGICFNQEELDSFNEAILANVHYQRREYVFLPLLLMILKKRRS